MFLRMNEARRHWGLNGLGGLSPEDRRKAFDGQIAYVRGKLSAGQLSDAKGGLDAAVWRIQGSAWDSERPGAVAVIRPLALAWLEASRERSAAFGTPDRQTLTFSLAAAQGAAPVQTRALRIPVDAFARHVSDLDRASTAVEASAIWGRALELSRATIGPAESQGNIEPASKVLLAGQVRLVRQAYDRALQRVGEVRSMPDPVPAPAPRRTSPGGGPLDTADRDQAIFDLASGRTVNLSTDPGGFWDRDYGRRDYGSAGGSSKAVAGVALAVAGVATIVLVAVVLRPRN